MQPPIDVAAAVRAQVMEQLKGQLGSDAKLKGIIYGSLLSGAKGAPESDAALHIRAVARGAIQGHLLLEKDLAEAAVQVMTYVSETSMEAGLDPAFAMRWALVGLAEAGEIAPPGTLENMRSALDRAFLGVGEVFSKACSELANRRAHGLAA